MELMHIATMKTLGRPPKATQAQIENMRTALSSIARNSQEYRNMRQSFAVAIGCTERAIELMVKRLEAKGVE